MSDRARISYIHSHGDFNPTGIGVLNLTVIGYFNPTLTAVPARETTALKSAKIAKPPFYWVNFNRPNRSKIFRP